TAFAVLYTKLVKTGEISLEQLVKALCDNPRKRFSLPQGKEDFTIFQVKTPYKINPDEFLSKGKSTPFDGEEVYGRCVLTVCGGKIVWQDDLTEN
ncbi:MAG: dihydroorotase, partial [Candidatus Scatosoma sp.]